MGRFHRGIKKRLIKIDAGCVANRAEDYLETIKGYRSYLGGISGLVASKRIRAHIKKIDAFERDMIRMEEKLDKLAERREMEAVKLEDCLDANMDILEEYLDPEELNNF